MMHHLLPVQAETVCKIRADGINQAIFFSINQNKINKHERREHNEQIPLICSGNLQNQANALFFVR